MYRTELLRMGVPKAAAAASATPRSQREMITFRSHHQCAADFALIDEEQAEPDDEGGERSLMQPTICSRSLALGHNFVGNARWCDEIISSIVKAPAGRPARILAGRRDHRRHNDTNSHLQDHAANN
jgi:hypothetical protein